MTGRLKRAISNCSHREKTPKGAAHSIGYSYDDTGGGGRAGGGRAAPTGGGGVGRTLEDQSGGLPDPQPQVWATLVFMVLPGTICCPGNVGKILWKLANGDIL